MSLWNWHVEFELKEDHQKIIGKLTDELWKDLESITSDTPTE